LNDCEMQHNAEVGLFTRPSKFTIAYLAYPIIYRDEFEDFLMSGKPTFEELEQKIKELEKTANDRVNSEKQLRESEEKYRFIVENADVGIFIAQNGVLKFSNIKLQALLGYSADELVRLPYKNLLHPGNKHLVKERKEKKLQGKELNSVYSLRIINKAGKEFWVEINSIPILWEGHQATLNFAKDITLQRKFEAQLQQARKMESIGTLAGSIAHKFNNLMTTVIGNAHMLLMSKGKDDSLIEGLEDIKSAGERAANLTRQILAFSRKQMILPKVLNLNEVLAGIASMFVHLIEENIELKMFYEPALGSVKMDPAQIDQVVMNLLKNARDAMPNGGTLTIETANVELGKDFFDDHGIKGPPGYYVMFSVTDTGTGMDERTQEHMFEPFYTTREVDKGSGLGLSTVYGIVKQNDGVIQVDSEIGRGSTFKIYLPVVKDDPGAEKKRPEP
jgi:two-component system, cell cycle sensor histidine kinase and response regulator CckA